MTTQLINHSPEIVAAIRSAFHTSKPCRCQGDGKLSEEQLLSALVEQRVIPPEIVDGYHWLPIRQLMRAGDFSRISNPLWIIAREIGCEFLPELQEWSRDDLLRFHGVGSVTVAAVERTMARYDMGLRGSTVERIERLKREEEEDRVRESERQHPEASPEEVRTEAARELVALGRQLIGAGASMMNSAIRVQAGKSLQPLRSYITKRNCAYRDVEAIIEPLSRLEDGERAAATPVVPKRRHIPDAPNVVSLAARRVS